MVKIDAVKLSTLLGFLGASAGGWIGWLLGKPVSFMAAFMLSTIGTGFGMYYGNKLGRHWS